MSKTWEDHLREIWCYDPENSKYLEDDKRRMPVKLIDLELEGLNEVCRCKPRQKENEGL